MIKYVIKLRLAEYTDEQLEIFAGNVASKMDGNLNYPTPIPSLIDIAGLITDFHDALTAWGPEGNRGSHAQHEAVLDTRDLLEIGLVTLANSCETETPYEKSAFLSAGWEVKKLNAPVGLVGPVRNFHQFISRLVPSGAVKLSWKIPLAAPVNSINVYRVMHSLTADINAAT